MMWLVRVALQRPYTFVVMSLLIAVLGIGSLSPAPPNTTTPASPPSRPSSAPNKTPEP